MNYTRARSSVAQREAERQTSAAGPESSALRAEERELLQRAVLRLPPTLRIVLALHDMEELTTEQTAAVLDLKPGTVRTRLHRARLSLRKERSALLAAPPAGKAAPMARKGKSPAQPRRKCTPQCRELFANLSEYLDGQMETGSCEQMQRHIEACPSCVAFLRELRAAIDRCRQMEIACDPELGARLRATLTREYLRLLMAPAAAR